MWNRKQTPASSMALGGVLAAASVVIMGLGGLIPIATYVCPVVAMLVLKLVLKLCGSRVAWAWYGAVAILSLILSPDKEAGAVFLFLGFYPIIKPRMDKLKLPWLGKTLFFNADILLLYWLLMYVVGMDALKQEFAAMGTFLVVSLLILGNLTFFLLDHLLGRKLVRKKKNG